MCAMREVCLREFNEKIFAFNATYVPHVCAALILSAKRESHAVCISWAKRKNSRVAPLTAPVRTPDGYSVRKEKKTQRGVISFFTQAAAHLISQKDCDGESCATARTARSSRETPSETILIWV
jgi:hypothetical protein